MEGSLTGSLDIRGLSKSFPGTLALADFTLRLAPTEVHALVGANGSGKSTVIKILSGFHAPDSGAVLVGGQPLTFASPQHSYRLGCRFVHQDLGLIPTMTVADNLHMGKFPTRAGTVGGNSLRRSARAMLARVGLDVDPSARVAELPAAQRTGIALARSLREDPDHPPCLLVLDEPTATLPNNEVDHLLEMVHRAASHGIAVLFVTHHLDEVFRIADSVTVLRDGRIVHSAPMSTLTRPRLVELLVGDEIEDLHPNPRTVQSDRTVLEVDDLWARPISGLSFSVAAGEILGLAGLTGSGRETALEAVFGGRPRQRGQVRINGTVVPPEQPARAIKAGAGLLPGDRKAQSGVLGLSARENISLPWLAPFWKGLRLRRRAERADALSWFTTLGIRPPRAIETELLRFSGGNQQKILFAKWIRRRPAVLLLDEPTQGVDIRAQADLHRHLLSAAAEGMAVVVSSTDHEELVSICSRVLILRNGLCTDEMTGSRLTSRQLTRAVLSDTSTTVGRP